MASRILIVEDDESVRSMLELTLSVEGYETELLVDGNAAMARLDLGPPDLVILDIMIPGANGFEVLQEMRQQDGWEDIPVVICTALKDDDDLWRGWSSGADYVLIKPFDLDHLRSVVHRLLQEARVD